MSNAASAFESAPITVTVYHDQNLNGVRDPAEPGVPNVSATAFDASNALLAVGQTDAQGMVTLTLSAPNTPVRVEFTNIDAAFSLGAGMEDVWFVSGPARGLQLALNRSSDYCAGPTPAEECAAAPIRMTGRIWHDANANGLQDVGEEALAGVTVRLYDEHDTLIGTQLTQQSGLYTLTSSIGNYGPDGLPNTSDDASLPGLKPSSNAILHTYTVRLDTVGDFSTGGKLNGFNITQVNALSGPHSELRDSDAGIANGFPQLKFTTDLVGASITTFDMGLFQPLAVGGLAWLDDNHDGQRAATEALLPGVGVELYTNNNTLIATSLTRGNGIYRFLGLLTGRYKIRFGTPVGYTFTTPLSGTDSSLNSDATFPLGFAAPFSLTVGKLVTNVDVGLLQLPASLSVTVLANGAVTDLQGPSLLGGMAITWRYMVTNTGTVALTKIAVQDENLTRVTCPTKELAPGAGMTCTAQAIAMPGLYSSRIRVNSINGAVLAGDDSVAFSVLAHYRGIAPASVRGRVWFDANHDSQKSGDELRVPDGTVTLYRVENGLNNALISGTVNNNGDYAFGGLAPGAYRWGLTLLPEHGLAVSTAGPDSATNNDFDPASAQTAVFNLSEGQIVDNIDAGIWANQPRLALALYVNQQDGGQPPGVLTLADTPLAYSYVVMNLGTEPVSQILVSDTVSGLIACPKSASLQPNQQLVCQSTVENTNSKGQNRATASALTVNNGIARELIATDQAYFLTGMPHLTLHQSALPTHNTPVANGTVITYLIAVANNGSFTASNITLENTIAPGSGLLLESVVPSATNAATVYNTRGVVPLRWVLPALGPDQVAQMQFSTKVSAALDGSLSAIVQANAKAQSSEINHLVTGNQLVHPFLPTAIVENNTPNLNIDVVPNPIATINPIINSDPNLMVGNDNNSASPIGVIGTPNPQQPLAGLSVPGGAPAVVSALPVVVGVSTVNAQPRVAQPVIVDQPIATSTIAPAVATVAPVPLTPAIPVDAPAATPVLLPTGMISGVLPNPTPAPNAVSTAIPLPPVVPTSSRTLISKITPPAVRVLPSATAAAQFATPAHPALPSAKSVVATPTPFVGGLQLSGVGLLVTLGLATLVFGAVLVGALWWLVS